MEFWRRAWRDGIAPQLSLTGLVALRDAIVRDDQKLVQGTVVKGGRCGGGITNACAIGICALADGAKTTEEVHEYFDQVTEQGACADPFIEWFDYTQREIMRRELLPEVELAIKAKGGA